MLIFYDPLPNRFRLSYGYLSAFFNSLSAPCPSFLCPFPFPRTLCPAPVFLPARPLPCARFLFRLPSALCPFPFPLAFCPVPVSLPARLLPCARFPSRSPDLLLSCFPESPVACNGAIMSCRPTRSGARAVGEVARSAKYRSEASFYCHFERRRSRSRKISTL